MIKKLSYIMSEYKTLRRRLDSNVRNADFFKALLGSLVINAIIFLIPILLIENLFILTNIMTLLKVFIFIIIILFSIMYHYIYSLIIKNYKEEIANVNFKLVILIEGSITAFILSIFALIVMTMV
ncbi:MAG: hypothetical protein RBQ97_10420 [Acholeplasma sp.]|nr:hypothetical protein [Acholeplasma sp.]